MTYSKYQNFNGEIDTKKEHDTVLYILRPDLNPIEEKHPDMKYAQLVDTDYLLAYRLLLEEGEEATRESLESYYDLVNCMIVFNYYTDDIEAIEENPIDYLSTNYDDLYTEDGHEYDDDTGEKLETKLQFDKNYAYVINGWTYEVRN